MPRSSALIRKCRPGLDPNGGCRVEGRTERGTGQGLAYGSNRPWVGRIAPRASGRVPSGARPGTNCLEEGDENAEH